MRAILLLLVALSAAVTVVQSHNSQNNNGDNGNNHNNDGNHWGNSVKGWDKDQWKNLSWYLKRLPQKQFFGMHFVLNITGERCIPDWHFPKPPCWHPGWPWPWPGHGTTTKRPTQTTKSIYRTTTTVKGTHPTVGPTTNRPTVGPTAEPTTSTSTTTSTTTTTTTTTTAPEITTPTTSVSLSTTSCPYDWDLGDDANCVDIRNLAEGRQSPFADCKNHFSNETIINAYYTCVQFQCKYQRHYRCYGEWAFAEECRKVLTADESLYGWRWGQGCPVNSTPFPPITFTDLPTTATGNGVVKRHANWDTGDDGEEDDEPVTEEGTKVVAFGIKNNWCVPRIFSYWWRKHGNTWPGDDNSNSGGNSNEGGGHGHGGNSNEGGNGGHGGWNGGWGNGKNSNDNGKGHGGGSSNGGKDQDNNN